MTIWALLPPALIPRDFFPWIEMQASTKTAGRRARQLKPLCCLKGNAMVHFRQRPSCYFLCLMVLAPYESRWCGCEAGLQLRSLLPGTWEAPFGCSWEDTKEEGLVELIRPGSTPGQVLVCSMESLSGVRTQHFSEPVFPRTCISHPHPHPSRAIIYCVWPSFS